MKEVNKLKKYLYYLVVLLKDKKDEISRNSISSIQIELFKEIALNESKQQLINRLKLLIKNEILMNKDILTFDFIVGDIISNLSKNTKALKMKFTINPEELTIEYNDECLSNQSLIINLQ